MIRIVGRLLTLEPKDQPTSALACLANMDAKAPETIISVREVPHRARRGEGVLFKLPIQRGAVSSMCQV